MGVFPSSILHSLLEAKAILLEDETVPLQWQEILSPWREIEALA
jgi:hypothetical protein